MGKFIDITGKRFGLVSILRKTDERTKDNRIVWECRCDCGKVLFRSAKDLKSGHTKSCGCFRDEVVKNNNPNTRHSLRYHPLYKKLMDMKSRCYNKNNKRYYLYGERGIKICKGWLDSIQAFVDWATKTGWTKEMTIDRIDSNKDYCPENCQWLTRSEHSIKTNIERSGGKYVHP